MSSRAKVLVVAMVALALLPALLSACPLCKDALEDKTTGVTNELGRGFYYSILLMVSAPFLVLSGLFLRIYRIRRRARLEERVEADDASAPRLLPDPRGARS
jgi:hypothetical protein